MLALVALAMIPWNGCGKRSEGSVAQVTDPREAALVLLQAAQTGRTSRQDLAGVTGELTFEGWADLADALRPLRATTRARILSVEELGAGKTAVDLEVALPGEGNARYRVHAAGEADGTWRIVSLDGPGVAWPRPSASRDDGLSTSAPPRPAGR